MIRSVQPAKYDKEMKAIKKNRKTAVFCLISALVLLICLCFPLELKLLSVHWVGLKTGTAILLALLCIVIFFIAWIATNLPISASMNKECDPEKYIALSSAFLKNERLDSAYASALSYIGDYDEALPYAKNLINSGNKPYMLSGYFCKFRCEYFKEEYDLAKASLDQFSNLLYGGKKMNSKLLMAYERMHNVMKFMLAIAEDDTDTLDDIIDVLAPWSDSVPVLGLVTYLRGVYAFRANDTEEAIYNFKWVIKSCNKTVLSDYSRDLLSKIKAESDK